jgi:LPS sulfotransferase NodH
MLASEADLDSLPFRPFFVVGAARSGTTLLRVQLDRHPELAVPPESHFIPHLWRRRRRYGREGRVERPERFLADLRSQRRFREWNVASEQVGEELPPSPTLGQAIEAAYRAYAKAHGKSKWGDKTPRYVTQLPLLARLFPEARFVHLVRDGRDVALSLVGLGHLHAHPATAAFPWARQVAKGRAAGHALGPGRYVELRYEELVANPEGVLQHLCRSLGLAFAPEMLEHRRNETLEKIPPDRRRYHTRLALPPTEGLRDWRRDMDPAAVAEFEALAGAELVASGYELSGRPISTGTRVRAWLRAARFAVRILGRRPRVRRRRKAETIVATTDR